MVTVEINPAWWKEMGFGDETKAEMLAECCAIHGVKLQYKGQNPKLSGDMRCVMVIQEQLKCISGQCDHRPLDENPMRTVKSLDDSDSFHSIPWEQDQSTTSQNEAETIESEAISEIIGPHNAVSNRRGFRGRGARPKEFPDPNKAGVFDRLDKAGVCPDPSNPGVVWRQKSSGGHGRQRSDDRLSSEDELERVVGAQAHGIKGPMGRGAILKLVLYLDVIYPTPLKQQVLEVQTERVDFWCTARKMIWGRHLKKTLINQKSLLLALMKCMTRVERRS